MARVAPLVLLLAIVASALAQTDDCVWDRVVEQAIDYQLSALAVRDDEVFALGGLQVTAPLKADTPHLAVVSLRKAAQPLLLTLPGANETHTGEVSEIVTVTDGNHFVVVSVGIGLFLIETDATDGTPVVEALFPIPGLTLRSRITTDVDRELLYVAASSGVYVLAVQGNSIVLEGSTAVPAQMTGLPSSVALSDDDTILFVGSFTSGTLSVFDVSQPSNPQYTSTSEAACFADTLAVNGDFIYTANSTNMCVYDYSQNMWMRGTFLVSALYISSSPFDPWIYVTETTTSDSMILTQFTPTMGSWQVNISKFANPFTHPNCIVVKHSQLVQDEVFLACENVVLSLQYVCIQPPTTAASATAASTASTTATASSGPATGTSASATATSGSVAVTTGTEASMGSVTLAATFTTAQVSSSSGHSHAGRTVGIVFGSLILVALVGAALAGLRWYWVKQRNAETTPLL